jgi:hypothetical protein
LKPKEKHLQNYKNKNNTNIKATIMKKTLLLLLLIQSTIVLAQVPQGLITKPQ